ncbi:MAG: CAP domain-containing protein [Paludibacteraceae bacterium]|nr:CAP domain-containing protein [Paludibacteraceae bacterium]
MRKLLTILLSGVILFGMMVSCVEEEIDTILNDTPEETQNDSTKIDEGEEPEPEVVSLYTDEELAMANTAADVDYLTEEEKKVIFLCNLARLDGERFAEEYLTPYVEKNKLNVETNEYLASLYTDLSEVKDHVMLRPSKELCDAAAYHAKDSGENGITGHVSSDGTDWDERLERFVPSWYALAENCTYGSNRKYAIYIVMNLLIDENISSLGHRKNILSDKYNHIGVSIMPHSSYTYNCVQDFAKL